jgi:enoyl-[acyl-carrier protein] reductase II
MEKNRICNLLGIRYPIIQAPMNWVSGAQLVAAVSNAGGLGTLGPNAGGTTRIRDVEATAEGIRQKIRAIKNLTDNPFAVNIPVGFSEEERKYSKRIVDVALEEGLSVAIVSVGSPDVYTKASRMSGLRCFMPSLLRHTPDMPRKWVLMRSSVRDMKLVVIRALQK